MAFRAEINTGNGYATLAPNVLEDYAAKFGTAIGAYQLIGISAKVVNAQTGLASEFLRFLVRQ